MSVIRVMVTVTHGRVQTLAFNLKYWPCCSISKDPDKARYLYFRFWCLDFLKSSFGFKQICLSVIFLKFKAASGGPRALEIRVIVESDFLEQK